MSRKSMKRTASLGDLDWIQDGDWYIADLPVIPGYSTPDNPAVAGIYHSLAGYWMLTITIGDGDHVLDEATFGDVPGAYSYTPQQWKDYVESLTPEEIAALFDKWDPNEVDASRHARHTTRRQADVDPGLDLEDLGLDWQQDDTWEGEYMTILPAIPGCTQSGDPNNYACVYPVNPENPLGWEFNIRAGNADAEINLYSTDFGLSLSENAEDAMATVGSILVEALVDAFEHPTSAFASRRTVSRKGHKMIRKATKRTANLNLDWSEQPGGFYLAYLPSLPGYPSNPYEPNSVIVDTVDYESVNDEGVYDPDAGGWSFRMLLHANSEEMASLYPYTFTNSEEPFATAQEAMQFVDNLTLEDISQVLDDLDYLPLLDENGDWVTASLQASRKPRHATRRKRTLA